MMQNPFSLARIAAPALALAFASLAAACSPVGGPSARITPPAVQTPTSMNRSAEERWFDQATYGEDS